MAALSSLQMSSPIQRHSRILKTLDQRPLLSAFTHVHSQSAAQSRKHILAIKTKTPRGLQTPKIPRASSSASSAKALDEDEEKEVVFFDGGAHYGDLAANLIFGFSILWLPLTIAAVFRAMFLRYRFTNLRVSVISGLTGSDRKDFSYRSVKDVQVVPRLFGQWGDIVITLDDDSKVDLRSVPMFREVADYCLFQAKQAAAKSPAQKASGRKGFL
eukprot:TRINITY_DN539_c0_g1_i1.p1 TRINITY_DN539_c0_g1~~TRINITY_DN539_c0_g1_i1.p1  ORF type:complete len:239 (-),score=21.25 TRINITY_DN539_c0_g1_i1:327-971(-)